MQSDVASKLIANFFCFRVRVFIESFSTRWSTFNSFDLEHAAADLTCSIIASLACWIVDIAAMSRSHRNRFLVEMLVLSIIHHCDGSTRSWRRSDQSRPRIWVSARPIQIIYHIEWSLSPKSVINNMAFVSLKIFRKSFLHFILNDIIESHISNPACELVLVTNLLVLFEAAVFPNQAWLGVNRLSQLI